MKIGEIACALSQEAVLKGFIESKTKNMLMLEDDNVPFSNEFYKNVGLKLEFIKDYMSPGMENLDYDEVHPNEDWVTDNIEGSSRTGNNPKWANAVETPVNKNRNKIRKRLWVCD